MARAEEGATTAVEATMGVVEEDGMIGAETDEMERREGDLVADVGVTTEVGAGR